ncbi:FMN-binding protein [Aliikangiella sp. G2MR2-5]|uniref:FMN-binding protein n=1 Tax=Aliikangiella sp. G2MR2-5 TaxID=2788943 RepID=UPI0018AAA4EC|nr:FMN-binding protein [Aliikangiella sp. G2MR2-5]
MNNPRWSPLVIIPVSAVSMPSYAIDYLTAEEAQQQIFSSEHQFVETPLLLSDDNKDQIKDLSGVRQRKNEQKFWKVMQGDQQVGWFTVDDVIGKHEYISYAVGIDLKGEVTGVEILSYRETHGGQVRQADWRQQFVGKSLQDSVKLGKDINNISGATLSCRNITDGVKRLLVIHKLFLISQKVS